MQALSRWHRLSFLAFFLSIGKNHRTTVHPKDALAEKVNVAMWKVELASMNLF